MLASITPIFSDLWNSTYSPVTYLWWNPTLNSWRNTYAGPLFQYKLLTPSDEETHSPFFSNSPRHSICYTLSLTLLCKLFLTLSCLAIDFYTAWSQEPFWLVLQDLLWVLGPSQPTLIGHSIYSQNTVLKWNVYVQDGATSAQDAISSNWNFDNIYALVNAPLDQVFSIYSQPIPNCQISVMISLL